MQETPWTKELKWEMEKFWKLFHNWDKLQILLSANQKLNQLTTSPWWEFWVHTQDTGCCLSDPCHSCCCFKGEMTLSSRSNYGSSSDFLEIRTLQKSKWHFSYKFLLLLVFNQNSNSLIFTWTYSLFLKFNIFKYKNHIEFKQSKTTTW